MEEKNNEDLYQVMPPLSEEEYASLKDDIKEHGVMVPVEIDEAGNVLDGYHRIKACKELGITDFPTVVRAGWTAEEKYEHALRLNMRRRHLSGEQLKKVIRDFKEKHPDVSNRQVAKATGVSAPTVASYTDDFAGVKNLHVQNVQGADGKSYPSSEAQAEQQRQDIRDMINNHHDMNNHQIAMTLNVSDHTVKKVHEEMDSESNINDDPASSAQKEDKEKTYDPPYAMTSGGEMRQILLDEADSTKEWLHFLIFDCAEDPGKAEMLSSTEGSEKTIEGLVAFKEAVDQAIDDAIAHLQDKKHKA